MNEAPLPQALRQDLRLYASGPGADGGPTWAIQDPVSNRFFRIGWLEFECLLRWYLPGGPAFSKSASDTDYICPLQKTLQFFFLIFCIGGYDCFR